MEHQTPQEAFQIAHHHTELFEIGLLGNSGTIEDFVLLLHSDQVWKEGTCDLRDQTPSSSQQKQYLYSFVYPFGQVSCRPNRQLQFR